MTFNSVGFSILGIPAYFFCACIGLVIAICTYISLLFSKEYLLSQHMKVLAISIIGMAVVARAFGCLTGVYRIIGQGEKVTFESIKNTGIVFYGGLLGLFLTYGLCIKVKLVDDEDYHVLDVLAVVVPLFHAIARVGCFLAGCCFGIRSECPLAINYTVLEKGCEITVPRLPVQLFESVFNLFLFIYLLMLLKNKNWKNKQILCRYLMLYSCGRFLLEFIRGDSARGLIAGISFSQMLSVLIWIVLFVFNLKKRKTKEDIKWEQ